MSNFYAHYPITGGGGGVTSLNGQTGALTLVAGANITITPGAGTLTISGDPGTVNSIGTFDSQPASANGLVITGNSLYAQSATTTDPGMVNTGTQAFAGQKEFTALLTLDAGANITGETSIFQVLGSQALNLQSASSGSDTVFSINPTGSWSGNLINAGLFSATPAAVYIQQNSGENTYFNGQLIQINGNPGGSNAALQVAAVMSAGGIDIISFRDHSSQVVEMDVGPNSPYGTGYFWQLYDDINGVAPLFYNTNLQVLTIGTALQIYSGTPTTVGEVWTATNTTGAGTWQSNGLSNYLPLTGGTLSGPGNLTIDGTLAVISASTLDGGQIKTDGTGNLTLYGNGQAGGPFTIYGQSGTLNFSSNSINWLTYNQGNTTLSLMGTVSIGGGTFSADGNLIFTDGSGNLTVNTLIAAGAGTGGFKIYDNSGQTTFNTAGTDWLYYNGGDNTLILSSASVSANILNVTSVSTANLQITTTPVAGYVLTSDSSGNGTWQALPAGGANTALSNLAVTAVNQSLLPQAAGTLNFGSATLQWNAGYFNSLFGNAWYNLAGSVGAAWSGTTALISTNGPNTTALGSPTNVWSGVYTNNIISTGTTSLDNGNITTNGAGTLTASGTMQLAGGFSVNGLIYTGGPGFRNLTIEGSLGVVSGLGVVGGTTTDTLKITTGTPTTVGAVWSATDTAGDGAWGPVNSSQVLGTTAGGNAPTGYIGEFISANPGSGVAVGSTGAFVTITSISLTAGDWDVEGTVSLVTGASTAGTVFSGGISLNTTSEDSQANGGVFDSFNTLVASSTYLSPTGKRRINISATTTVYLVGAATYTIAGGATWGTNSFIGARRVR